MMMCADINKLDICQLADHSLCVLGYGNQERSHAPSAS